jgi:ribonucleoside-diphosphate reductase beta chain
MDTKITKSDEILLKENKDRFILFPIKHKRIWKMYKTAEASFWTAEEVDLSGDIKDWKSLTDNERTFIENVLAFFASSDGIVAENLAKRFMGEVQLPEARCFYGFQIMIENIHAEMYSKLLQTFVDDPEKRYNLFHALESNECIKQKASWAMKYITSSDSFAERIVAFACVEGIFFSGAFCAIFWLKKRGKMPGLTFSNELIARDEGLHCDFACELYSMLVTKLSQDEIYTIIKEAVKLEKLFVADSLKIELIGMNAKSMSEYIEFVADRLIVALGYKKIWNTSNPFEWMDIISLQGKTNFFERRVGDYQKAGVLDSVENKNKNKDKDKDKDDIFVFDHNF